MKHLFLALLVSPLLYACNSTPSENKTQNKLNLSSADSTGIMDNFNKQEACWNKHDIECYMEAYDTVRDIQTISRAGVTQGYDSIITNYKKYFPKDRMGNLHFDEIRLKSLGETYSYVVGRYNLKYETKDTVYQGWFSVLMEKKDNKWYIISDHS